MIQTQVTHLTLIVKAPSSSTGTMEISTDTPTGETPHPSLLISYEMKQKD